MIRKVVLVHGWGGSSPEHWQHWLQKELEKKGIQTFFPILPHFDSPLEKEWVNKIENTTILDEDTILIGHSLGVPTILRVIEKLPNKKKVRAVILVAGFCRDLGISEIQNFVNHPFQWKKIRQKSAVFIQIYSNNDPFISVDESRFLGQQLQIKPLLEKNGGHITAPQYGPYPRILKLVEKQTKK